MAFAGGKVILFGEHAVVHGRPALAAGLSVGVRALAESAETDRLTIEPWGVDVGPDGDEDLSRAFAAALALFDSSRSPQHVHAEVGLPGGAGLGCSASLGVAVIHALEDAFGISVDAEVRGEKAMAWERVFHGNPSGVDNMLAAVGGVAVFEKGKPLDRIRGRRALPLVIAHSGESSSTRELVSMVSRQYEREPERVGEIFDGISSLVRNAKLAVQDGDLVAIGQLMDMNQALLSSLMLSTERLELMCATARSAGALGAKLTGAGGGGCIIALASTGAEAEAIRQAIEPYSTFTLVAEAGK